MGEGRLVISNLTGVLLEQLAIDANGSYAHIDELDEDRKLFVTELTTMPQAIASSPTNWI